MVDFAITHTSVRNLLSVVSNVVLPVKSIVIISILVSIIVR